MGFELRDLGALSLSSGEAGGGPRAASGGGGGGGGGFGCGLWGWGWMLSVRRRQEDARGVGLRGGAAAGGMEDDAELEEGEACGDETAFVDPDVALSYIVSGGPSEMPAVSSAPVEFVAVSMLVW